MAGMHFDLYLTKLQKCQKPEIIFLHMLPLDKAFLFLCYMAWSCFVQECSFILDYTRGHTIVYSKIILGSKTV